MKKARQTPCFIALAMILFAVAISFGDDAAAAKPGNTAPQHDSAAKPSLENSVPAGQPRPRVRQANDLSTWNESPDGRLSPPFMLKNADGPQKSLYPDLRPEEPVITVNGEALTWRAMLRHAELMIMEMPLPSGVTIADFEEKREELTMRRIMRLANNFIVKTLFAQEARRNNLALTAQEVEAKRESIFAEVRKTLKRPQAHIDEFSRPDSYFSHDLTNSLLLSKLREQVVRPSIHISDEDIEKAKQARLATNEEYKKINAGLRPKLEAILQRLKAGESFSDLAFSESDCDSSYDGGELGTFKRGDTRLRPEITDAAFAMEEGAISGIVETPYSFHIIKLLKKNYAPREEGATEPSEPLSVKIAHIMLEKKELLPPHTDETARKQCQQEREEGIISAMRERLLKEAKIETPLTLY